MEFKEALETLGIEKYGEAIFSSNSHGELFHLEQYSALAKAIGETDWFPKWFESVVSVAEENWERPQSVYQHITTIFLECCEQDK